MKPALALVEETKKVEAFACGACEVLHRTRHEADACCRCSSCAGKFTKTNNYTTVCDGCIWGERVREARRAIKRADEQVKSAHRALADLLGRKPPKAVAASGGPCTIPGSCRGSFSCPHAERPR